MTTTKTSQSVEFKSSVWVQNGRVESRILGHRIWRVSTDGTISCDTYDLEGKFVSIRIISQFWKGRPKKFLCIPTGEYVHRLVAQCFVPNPDGHKHVRFLDGDVSNVNASNLEWHTVIKKGIPLGKRKR